MTETKTEFEARYAELSGIPWDQLAAMGYRAVPCDCGEPDCRGWRADCDLAVAQQHLLRAMCDAAYQAGMEIARRREEAFLEAFIKP